MYKLKILFYIKNNEFIGLGATALVGAAKKELKRSQGENEP